MSPVAGISPGEYLGLGPVGYHIGRELFGGREEDLVREQIKARVAAGEDPTDVLNQLGPRIYPGYQPIESATQREMRARGILGQTRPFEVEVPGGPPTGRYEVGPSLGERVFETPGGGTTQEIPYHPDRPERAGIPTPTAYTTIQTRQRAAGVPAGPAMPYASAYDRSGEIAATAAIPTGTPRREPIERVPVVRPELEYPPTVRRGERPITLAEAFAEAPTPQDYRALRQYGPGLEQERGFDILEQALRAGLPLDQALTQLLPTLMRGAKSTEWDSIIKAVNATNAGDFEQLAVDLAAQGDTYGAMIARSGNQRLLLQHLINKGKADLAKTDLDTRKRVADDLRARGLHTAADLLEAGKGAGPAGGLLQTQTRERGLGERQKAAIEGRKQIVETINQTRLKVAELRGGGGGGGGDIKRAQVALAAINNAQRRLEAQMKLEQAAREDARIQSLPTEDHDQALEAARQLMGQLDQEAAAIRQTLTGGPAQGGPGGGGGGPTGPGAPEGPRPAQQGRATNPRERADQLARQRFGRGYLELSRQQRDQIAAELSSEGAATR
jgi:hypothetical protein